MPKAKENTGFSESNEALEEIIDQFKSGSLTLEEALTLFEQGVGHVKVCQQHLYQAKGKVEELVKTLQDDGESVTEDFD